MNVALWILRVLLALHTVTGALWKFSNPEQTVPSLQALPHGVWLALAVLELACSVGLVVPASKKPLLWLAPAAAGFIAAEMLLYTAVHFASGAPADGQVVYWAVVAVFAGFIGAARLRMKPA